MPIYNYDINEGEQAAQVIRKRRRTDRNISWVKMLLRGVRQVYQFFASLITSWRNKVIFNSSVIYMEHALNDVFGPGIYITDADFVPVQNDYLIIEDKPLQYEYLISEAQPPEYDYTVDEVNLVHFIVHVPDPMTAQQELQIREIVDCHKLPNKNYIIVTY